MKSNCSINEIEASYVLAAQELRSRQAAFENHANELHLFIDLRDALKVHPEFQGSLPETYYSGGDLDPHGIEGNNEILWGQSAHQSWH